jgi:trans-2,3-dihydro-3-hydroxyanthranilate isomerase
MPSYSYLTVDVFTRTRFGGNPLAVIPDARGLSDAEMQAIAAEFHYSETTFVLPPEDAANTARVRIFTPTSEVPFAGHPNVGTAFVLGRQGEVCGRPVGARLRFEEAAGLVEVELLREGDEVAGAAITAPRPLALGPELPAELIAACASLEVGDIAVDAHQPRIVSVGLSFAVAALGSRAALARARPNPQRFAEADAAFPQGGGGFAVFVYVPSDSPGINFHARMFAPLDNVPEDPATGSASAALAAFLGALDPAPTLTRRLVIMQGEDMGRPSRIELAVRKNHGAVEQVVIGGNCVPVMEGVLSL